MRTRIFGYGSLIWRPDFPYLERRPARLEGWARRFWQGSTDHRGVPGAPGRVVTLVERAEARCWGVAYTLAPQVAEEVIAALDHRERGGYARRRVEVWDPASGARVRALAWFATPANPNYLGPAPLEEIARTVLHSRGPSGPNADYLLRLDDALTAMGADDPHVRELARLVRQGLGKHKGL